jgi:hypothetical protein
MEGVSVLEELDEPENVQLTTDPYNMHGLQCYEATANPLDQVEAEYDFSKEDGVIVCCMPIDCFFESH